MDTVSARIYSSKNAKGKFVFPEQQYYGIHTDDVAMAMSGGGSRAFTMSMAAVRFLERIGLMSEVSYTSTVSGSNWFIAPYTFRELNLGGYRDSETITLEMLESNNIGFAGDVCINTPIFDKLKEGKNFHIPHDKLWQYVVGKCFLEPYGLNSKSMVMNQKRAKHYMENNLTETEVPIEGRPFWISNAAVECNKGCSNLTSTPAYAGISSRVSANDDIVGGVLIETPCFDSRNPCIEIKPGKQNVDLELIRSFTINDIIGASSAAFSYIVEQLDDKIMKYIKIKSGEFETLNPKFNFWDSQGENNTELVTTDGYRVDNLGIVSLLSRRCKKILCMCANLEIESSLLNTNLYPLFGIWNENGGSADITDGSQVFYKEDWIHVKNYIEDKMRIGGPVYLHKRLRVKPNKRLSVEGNYEVELLIFFLYPSVNYISLLNPEIQAQMNTGENTGSLNNFPNYKTVFQNKKQIAGYTRIQVNLLHYYVQWCLKTCKHLIVNFFHSEIV